MDRVLPAASSSIVRVVHAGSIVMTNAVVIGFQLRHQLPASAH
jgi:hypothetical protein